MPIKKTQLIILKRSRIQESSLYLICMTRDFGKMVMAAKGAVRTGSALAEALQYFVVADVVFYHYEKKAIDYISKAEIAEHFDQIAGDEKKFGFASAALEFVNLFLPEQEANQQIYFTLKKTLRVIDKSTDKDFHRELLHFWYLLCIFSGYAPELGQCGKCGAPIKDDALMFDPERGAAVCRKCVGDRLTIRLDAGTVKVLDRLARTDISDHRKITVTAAQLDQIRSMLGALTEYHLGKRVDLKSFAFLRKLDLIP